VESNSSVIGLNYFISFYRFLFLYYLFFIKILFYYIDFNF